MGTESMAFHTDLPAGSRRQRPLESYEESTESRQSQDGVKVIPNKALGGPNETNLTTCRPEASITSSCPLLAEASLAMLQRLQCLEMEGGIITFLF